MSLEMLQTYYAQWVFEFPSQADFYKSFASPELAQPPADVFAALHPS